MKHLQRLNKYFIKYKWHFILGTLFTVFSNYFGVQMPRYVQLSIDELKATGLSNELNDALWLAVRIGGLYLLLSVGKGFFLFLMRQTLIIMSRRIEYDIKNEVFNHYLSLDTAFYKRNRIGDLMNRISEDVSQVRMYLGPGIMYSINLVVLSVMSIYQMFQINVTLAFFALLPLPLMSYLIYRVSNNINAASKSVQEEQSRLTTIAQETLVNIRLIKAYNQNEASQHKMQSAAETYKGKSMRLVLINALFMPTILLLIGASTLIVIYVGGVLTESKQLSLGAIVAFLFYVNNLTWPFVSIGWVTSIIQRAAASQQRINEFLATEPTITNPTEIPFKFEGNVRFSSVSLTYEDTGIHAIKNLSFDLNQGSQLGILGRTGSGKSSVIALLTRQIEANSGAIEVDHQALNSINLYDLRKRIAVVPQDVFLFSDTIRNNVTFGCSEPVDDATVIEALKMAHVWHNIEEFPEGLDTLLGELGVNLSGGQKQRISIARALIRKPALLILDDCLSAVDTETEEVILNQLNQLPYQPTIITVSHRISTLRNCQNILVLEEGSMVEYGNPQSLLDQKGQYFEMVKQQLNESPNT
ncbi:MAG: ABC transporter ATP-binding protein [Flavobacteriia bacterium]|jgi:ATP-binding cassette subfamily B protein|nr:ABC transporter ATP-binding protein [Flavobacteriia bacterium]